MSSCESVYFSLATKPFAGKWLTKKFVRDIPRTLQNMAKTSTVVRSQKTPKFSTRQVNRCFRCGRRHGYMRDFGLCRICFRELANEGMIPGIRKSSW